MVQAAMPLACLLSMIRPPGIAFENSYLQILPIDKFKCPYIKNNNDIGLQLYTPKNPTVFEELFINDDARLAASPIDFSRHTVIYFHAFLEEPNTGSGLRMREAYMLRGDTNMIMVDAQRLEAGPWYLTAADNTWHIGQFTAQFVDYLVSRGLDLSRTHFIGHSLGAQSAGVAGSQLKSGRVSRITGLDPAMPLFEKLPLNQKLDASDAEFVDVIHTDAGIFGVSNPLGHADFYPNGGISPQPGCELEFLWPKQQILPKDGKDNCPKNGTYLFTLEPLKPSKSHKKSSIFGHVKNKGLPLATTPPREKKDLSKTDTPKPRTKRFISLFRRPQESENDNFLFKMLDFLVKHRRSIVPVVSVVREINTMVKSGNGELAHTSKERNNYIGTAGQNFNPINLNLELGNDPGLRGFVKRIMGRGTSDKLSVQSGGGGLFG